MPASPAMRISLPEPAPASCRDRLSDPDFGRRSKNGVGEVAIWGAYPIRSAGCDGTVRELFPNTSTLNHQEIRRYAMRSPSIPAIPLRPSLHVLTVLIQLAALSALSGCTLPVVARVPTVTLTYLNGASLSLACQRCAIADAVR